MTFENTGPLGISGKIFLTSPPLNMGLRSHTPSSPIDSISLAMDMYAAMTAASSSLSARSLVFRHVPTRKNEETQKRNRQYDDDDDVDLGMGTGFEQAWAFIYTCDAGGESHGRSRKVSDFFLRATQSCHEKAVEHQLVNPFPFRKYNPSCVLVVIPCDRRRASAGALPQHTLRRQIETKMPSRIV